MHGVPDRSVGYNVPNGQQVCGHVGDTSSSDSSDTADAASSLLEQVGIVYVRI